MRNVKICTFQKYLRWWTSAIFKVDNSQYLRNSSTYGDEILHEHVDCDFIARGKLKLHISETEDG